MFQKALLYISYLFCKTFSFPKQRKISWVVGVDEMAAFIKYLSGALENSYSVNFCLNPFYSSFRYNFNNTFKDVRLQFLLRLIAGPLLLGYLTNRADGFLYIWETGFLLNHLDQREFEFRFLKNRNKRIVCYFLGNDIRAPRLMMEYSKKINIEVAANYDFLLHPERLTDSYDAAKRKLAEVSEKYSNMIFNAPTDQMSYLKKEVQSFLYFIPDEIFFKNDGKYLDCKRVKVVHAPTAPITKGTQLVRAAITRLQNEGYLFDYIELIGMDNKKVLEALREAHIVLNEFYAFVPGMFGIEAMASHCALLTSADEKFEKALPTGSNNAWFVTRNYEIYDNLKKLLESPDIMKMYADAGYKWALYNAGYEYSGKKLSGLLTSIK